MPRPAEPLARPGSPLAGWQPLSAASLGLFLLRCWAWLKPRLATAVPSQRRLRGAYLGGRRLMRQPAWLDGAGYLLVLASVLLVYFAGVDGRFVPSTGTAALVADTGPADPAALAVGTIGPVGALAALLDPVSQLPWPGLLRIGLAGGFMFALLRALGARRFGSVAGAQAWALGSYFVVHADRPAYLDLAIWLPAVLLFGHGALLQRGPRRLLSLTAGGAAFGLACLTSPPGGLVVSLLMLWLYLAFRFVAGPVGQSSPARWWLRHGQPARLESRLAEQTARVAASPLLWLAKRALAVAVAAVGVPAIGLAIAAPRAPGLLTAVLDAPPAPALGAPVVPAAAGAVQLVLPFFFRTPAGAWWGLWPLEQTALYLGLAPLCFALFAAGLARRRATLFFGLLAAASLAVAFGLVSQLPDEVASRLTATFARAGLPGASLLIAGFALAVLAGLGADGFDRRLSRGVDRHSLASGLLAVTPFFVAFLLMDSLAWAARWLELAWASALDAIRLHYLPLGGPATRVAPLDLYAQIQQSVDPLAPATLWSVAVLLGLGLLLLARTQMPRLRAVWWVAILVLTAADLAYFGQSFDSATGRSALVRAGVEVASRPLTAVTTADRQALVLAGGPAGTVAASLPAGDQAAVLAPEAAGGASLDLLGLLSASAVAALLGTWLTLLPAAWVAPAAASGAARAPIWLPAWPWAHRDLAIAEPWRTLGRRWGRAGWDVARTLAVGAWWLLRALGRAGRLIVGWPVWMELACLLAMLGVALAFIWPFLSDGKLFYEFDIRHYYYPVTADLQRALAEGRLPLWTPRIFGGFPLFAEGETGSLYPFKLIALRFVDPAQALGWVGLANFVVAGWGMYFFGRALGLTRVASLIGGFSFQCSSFIVGQVHHTSLHSSAVWLPWVLAGAERGIRGTGIYRLSGAAIGGGALAMACFGLHPQPVLISVTLVVVFVCWRLLTGPFGFNWPLKWPGPWQVPGSTAKSAYRLTRNVAHLFWREVFAAASRLIQVPVVLGALFAAGFGLASIQLVPLLELASRSIRQGGVEYAFASTYSMPTFHVAQLLLPFGFRTDAGAWWTLWAPWETSLYAGVGTLILALVSIILVRSRLVVFFAVAAVASALIAFGEYAPIRLHEALYQLPGFSSLRVPGRFGLVTLVSICALAMIAADWMDRRFCSASTRPVSRLDRALTTVTIWLVAALAVALPAGLWWARRWLLEHPAEALAFIKSDYLGLRKGNTFLFDARQIYSYLLDALDPFEERTALALLLFGGIALSLVIWRAAPHWRHAWRIGLLGVVAIDGIAFATAYHQPLPIASFAKPEAADAWVAERIGTARVAVLPHGKITQSAALLPLGVNDIGGYSSLDPQRTAAFKDWMVKEGTELLNLGNIRYLIVPNEPNPMPSYQNVAVWPQRPLAEGKQANPNSAVSFAIDPFYADSVRVISGLFDAAEIKTGEPVAEIVVSNRFGGMEVLTLLAGRDTAEWAYDRPDVRAKVQHDRPQSAMKQPQTDPDGRAYEVDYFYAELPLQKPFIVDRIEFKNIHPSAGIRLFGLAIWDLNSYTSDSMTWERKTQFRQVYTSERSVVIENLNVYPKTRIVRRAVPAPVDQLGLYMMANENFDPRTMTYLSAPRSFWETHGAGPVGPIPAGYQGLPWPDRSWVTHYGDERVEIVAEADAPGYLVLHDTFLPGWRAMVDGVETPVYRADYLYRAVAIPPGRHTVVFSYEPESVAVGGLLTVIAAAGLALLWGYTFFVRPVLVAVLTALEWAIVALARGLYRLRHWAWPRRKQLGRLWRRWVQSNELPSPRWPA